jgi:hypothetical protein
MGTPQTYNIFNFDSQTNSVTFLNETTTGALPKEFQSDALPVSGRINGFDLSGVGVNGAFKSQQEVAGVYLDVAKVVANVFGIPNDALSGSAFGFNYVTLSAQVGLAVDLIQEVSTNAKQFTTYLFSNPVQVARETFFGFGSFSDWVTSVEVEAGESIKIRAGDAQKLAVLPVGSVLGTVDTQLSLNAVFKAPIKLMEIKGNGISLGPAFSSLNEVTLGNLASVSDSNFFFSNAVTGSALNLNFAGTEPPPAFAPGFVFFESTPDFDGKGTSIGLYTKVLNFGEPGCGEFETIGCIQDRTFSGFTVQRRRGLDADGNPIFTYAGDFVLPDRLSLLPIGPLGEQSSVAMLQRRVDTLPGARYVLPIVSGAVPEPANWAMMMTGFGLTGFMLRRKSRQLLAAA